MRIFATTFITLWPDWLELDLVLNPGVAVIPHGPPGTGSECRRIHFASRIGPLLRPGPPVDCPWNWTAPPCPGNGGEKCPNSELIPWRPGLIRIQLTAAFRGFLPVYMLAYRNGYPTNSKCLSGDATPTPVARHPESPVNTGIPTNGPRRSLSHVWRPRPGESPGGAEPTGPDC